MESVVKLDTKGRILIPQEIRETLSIRSGSEIILIPEGKIKKVKAVPLSIENVARCEVKVSNDEGGLSNVMRLLEMLNIGVLMSESKNLLDSGFSDWSLLLDVSQTKEKPSIIKERLTMLSSVTKVKYEISS